MKTMKKPLSQTQPPDEKIVPASVANQVITALKTKGIELSYDPELTLFSKAKDRFVTFPQLKSLLMKYEKQLTETTHWVAQLFGESSVELEPKGFEDFTQKDRNQFLENGVALSPKQQASVKKNRKQESKNLSSRSSKIPFLPKCFVP